MADRVRRFALLLEREHARALHSTSGEPGSRQVFSTAERVLERLDALEKDGKLVGKGGRRRLTYVSLFSGIEAATQAFRRVQSDAIPLAFSEVDQSANAVLRYLHPDVPRVGSILDVDWSALRGKVDLVVGGPPCQSFSVAGKRLGLSDPRGNLSLHFLRAVAAMRPEYFVFENVPGLLGSNDGRDFEALLEAVAELGGYHVAWRILDAKQWVPQRRARLWLVGQRAGSARGPCQILDIGEGQGWSPRSGKASWKAAARDAAGGPREVKEADWSKMAAWLDAVPPAMSQQGSHGAQASGDILAFQPMAGSKAGSVGAALNQTPTLGSASGGNRAPAVVYAADLRHGTLSQEASTLQVGPKSGWSLNASACVASDTVLRRLSPLECLRLQGMDDCDWLQNVRVGGKSLTDTDRYRLIGNSWAVPVAAWLFERLLDYRDAERTVQAA